MYTQPTMDSVQNFISSAAPLEVEVLVSQGLALIMMVCFVRAARIPGSTPRNHGGHGGWEKDT